MNRVSFGAQSLDAGELRRLGRRHSPKDVAAAVDAVRMQRAEVVCLLELSRRVAVDTEVCEAVGRRRREGEAPGVDDVGVKRRGGDDGLGGYAREHRRGGYYHRYLTRQQPP